METVVAIIAIVLGIVGIIGSVLPGLPGPPISWVGLLVLYFWGGGTNGAGEPMSTAFLLVWLAVTIVISIMDYLVPAYFTKLTGGSRHAGRGAIAGLLIGLIIPPVGMILGALLGAFFAEYFFGRRDAANSVKSSLGAFLGFLFGSGLKLIAAAVMLFYIVIYAF